MWVPVVNPKTEREAFDTHSNYIDCLSSLTNGLRLKYQRSLKHSELKKVDLKENLIKLTNKSLDDEYNIVKIDKDYSYASTSWLPIKSYYLLYHLLTTIDYIIKIQESAFSLGHARCVEGFTNKLTQGDIEFNNPTLNQVFDRKILDHKETTGANLSRRPDINRIYLMSIRKVARYKFAEWKRKEKIEKLYKKEDKEKSEIYLKNFKISIFEFPYYMRIRSNYREFAFIEGVNTTETAGYFESYYLFTKNFYIALIGLKKQLLKMRGPS